MKKMIIATDALKQVLKKLSQAVGKSTTLPAISNLYCKVGSTHAEFITTDLELTIQCTIECMSTGAPFEMLIPFDFMQKIIALARNAPIDFTLVTPVKLKIKGENDEYELNSLIAPELFPKMPELAKENAIVRDAEFITWLNKSMLTCSKDELRPAMTKACLDINQHKMVIVSTDAQSMFTHSFELLEKFQEQLLISPKMAKALDGFKDVEIYWNKNHVAFSSGSVIVIGTRHDMKYPDYKVVVPDYAPNLSVNREDLVAALERMCLSSAENKLTIIKLKQSAETVRFESNDRDMERIIKVEIPGTYSGEDVDLALNASRLLTILAQSEFQNIQLHINSKEKAVLVSSESDENYLGLIMPLLN